MTLILAPQRGPQTEFLASKADVVIYGGQAGAGKSFGLLLEPLRNINVPGFGAVIFRRTRPQVRNKGGLWDTSFQIYAQLPGAQPLESVLKWKLGDQVDVKFDHLEYDSSVIDWDGAQIPLLGFDQLEHFSRYQFTYMLSRNRSTCGIKPYCRATCNPLAGSWILELIGWYINVDGYPMAKKSGVIRYFYMHNDKFVTAWSKKELRETYKIPDEVTDDLIKSITFIPASLDDNPALTSKDPGYKANLLLQSEADRERLLKGNWKARKQGKLFKRSWFKIVERKDCPQFDRVVVGNDPSGGSGQGHDLQGIVSVAKGRDGKFYVLTDASCSLSPAGWGRVTIETYHEDKADKIVAEVNFGGEMVVSTIKSSDPYANVDTVSASRSKAVRAEPIAALYENGLIFHVGAKPELEDELAGFDPEDKTAKSPNRMDALVWAITELMGAGNTSALDYLRYLDEQDAAAKAAEN